MPLFILFCDVCVCVDLLKRSKTCTSLMICFSWCDGFHSRRSSVRNSNFTSDQKQGARSSCLSVLASEDQTTWGCKRTCESYLWWSTLVRFPPLFSCWKSCWCLMTDGIIFVWRHRVCQCSVKVCDSCCWRLRNGKWNPPCYRGSKNMSPQKVSTAKDPNETVLMNILIPHRSPTFANLIRPGCPC